MMDWSVGSLLIVLGVGLAVGIGEAVRHRKALRAIRIRIHVNGTRGKSSVTRLIAAALRAAGIRTVAKTTGTAPRLILPDGSERPIARKGRPNISEQVRTMKEAARLGAEALVVECMAVNPHYQRICEDRMVRSTLGVITNVREDHQDIMGETAEEIAEALCNTIPRGGIVVTGAKRCLETLREKAAKKGATVLFAEDGVPEGTVERFSYVEFEENVAVALKVCEVLGVGREAGLEAMTRVRPDPGALIRFRARLNGKGVIFVNAFAANDPESSLRVLERIGAFSHSSGPLLLVINCRGDRIQRSAQWGRFLRETPAFHRAILMGESTAAVVLALGRENLAKGKVIDRGGCPLGEVLEEIARQARSGALVVGLGNIVGLGSQLVKHMEAGGESLDAS